MNVAAGFNQDFLDILHALDAAGADFLVVGAHAMAFHGVPRATGDLDLLVRPSAANAAKVVAALRDFGAPIEAHGVAQEDFEVVGTVYQIGLPPRRIDLMTAISGVEFETAWESRQEVDVEGMSISFLGKTDLLANKRATGRDKDLVDVRLLTEGAGDD